ncbi:MAG: patatin-like phospholipase family protein [Bacteroidales bacterium]|nr:patatin-like phospholipase family protein [Bacteroidales bacterium]
MHKFWLITVLLINVFVFTNGQTGKRPKIALVLSGGGAKGFAHIGVLKVMEEEGIPIDIIVGTSMGSIVGGFYAIGYPAEEIEKVVKAEDWNRLLTDDIYRGNLSQYRKTEKQRFFTSLTVNDKYEPKVPQGVISGQNILNMFGRLAINLPDSADFTKFPIAFTCIGTNLETGREMILDYGYLPTAIFSSMTIPGVFLPVVHNGHLMLDGGLVNNFPTDVAKKMGADIIIGVDIRNDLYDSRDIVSLQQLMDQLINFYAISKDSANKSLCDILIRPDISGFNAYSFNSRAVDTLIQRGIDAARAETGLLRELKTSFNLPSPSLTDSILQTGVIYITELTITGEYSISEKYIRDYFGIDLPGRYTTNDIQAAIDKLFGSGFFKRVYFKIGNNPTGKTLNLVLEEQPLKSFNLGFRVNTRDAVSLLLNFAQKDFRRFIGYVSVTADISSNPGFDIVTEFSKGKWPVTGFELCGKNTSYGVYYNKQKAFTTDLFYASANLYTYKNLKKSSILGLGLKEEYYGGSIFNANNVDTLLSISQNQVAVSSLYTYYSFDNLDDYYFPEKGAEIYAEFSLTSDPQYSAICPVALWKSRKVLRIAEKGTLLINFYGRAILQNTLHPFKSTFLGGAEYIPYFNYHFPFCGIPAVTPADRYTLAGSAGLRIRFAKKHYATILLNCMFDNSELVPFGHYRSILGSALKYSAKTTFGPVDITAGFSGGYNKPVLSANLGLWF